ncbi:conjugal transfer protein [Alcaligenaceae bacterium]|nr:conjugal transfer protein [Alcaligenaceae bacterium]
MSIKIRFSRLSHGPVRQAWTAAMVASLTPAMALAQTGGLVKARTAMELLRDNLYIILPIVCVIIGLVIFALYAAEIMRKDDAVRWLIAVVGAGSVAEVVALLWK